MSLFVQQAMRSHCSTDRLKWGNGKATGLIPGFTQSYITSSMIKHSCQCQHCLFLLQNIGRWLPLHFCVMTDVCSSIFILTSGCELERAVHFFQLFSLVVHCSPSGFLHMVLQEGREPKITTNATTGFSYLPFFLWRREIYFTFWWDTRERMHVQEWVGHALQLGHWGKKS